MLYHSHAFYPDADYGTFGAIETGSAAHPTESNNLQVWLYVLSPNRRHYSGPFSYRPNSSSHCDRVKGRPVGERVGCVRTILIARKSQRQRETGLTDHFSCDERCHNGKCGSLLAPSFEICHHYFRPRTLR